MLWVSAFCSQFRRSGANIWQLRTNTEEAHGMRQEETRKDGLLFYFYFYFIFLNIRVEARQINTQMAYFHRSHNEIKPGE